MFQTETVLFKYTFITQGDLIIQQLDSGFVRKITDKKIILIQTRNDS